MNYWGPAAPTRSRASLEDEIYDLRAELERVKAERDELLAADEDCYHDLEAAKAEIRALRLYRERLEIDRAELRAALAAEQEESREWERSFDAECDNFKDLEAKYYQMLNRLSDCIPDLWKELKEARRHG